MPSAGRTASSRATLPAAPRMTCAWRSRSPSTAPNWSRSPAGDLDQLGAVDGERERHAQVMRGAAGKVALEDAVRPAEGILHPDGANLVDELQLLGQGRVLLDPQNVVGRYVATHPAVADQV